ncbi:MAG: thioesterase family protein [Clostridiales bacterium]|nr:thioesterase family protein [Clostridiales bacterium]
MFEIGIKGKQEMTVTDENSALAMGSGTLKVFATPSMAALMEKTAWMSVAPYLEEGQCTVGTKLNLSHVASTPIGMKVFCESELTAVDGRKLTFSITVNDEAGLIGKCDHERFIVEDEKFQKKTDAKMK